MILVASVSEHEEKNPEIITTSVWANISGLAIPSTTSAQQWGRLQLYSQGEVMLLVVKLMK